MKAVIQRCKNASVIVNGSVVGKIGQGIVVLLGVFNYDNDEDLSILAKKTANLRIFNDSQDKMNLSVKDTGGSVLVVSNFTLCADTKKGTRPSYSSAKAPKEANQMYENYCELLRAEGLVVEQGVFGADMEVNICGDGPVTITLDTDMWVKRYED
jgi:D-tyrosyl-tRNA(Tyr) deacylase